ncbi:MAG TPA: hypothetical protein VKF80_06320 [Candidatus Eisenbacteria bacterium]|nr:hypothetical protein [Candidatus Eisenbacteria bacterium]
MRARVLTAVLAGALAASAASAAQKPDANGETPVPTPKTYQAQAQQSAQQVKQAVTQKVKQAQAATNAMLPHWPAGSPPASKASAASKTPAPPAAAASKTTAAAKTGSSPGALAKAPKTNEERHLLNREVYVYKTVGRRDPFASLLTGEFETTVGRPLLDVSSMKLVGIVWGTSDKFALVEDGRGHGHVLRVGDPVINGSVVGLTKEELMIRQSSYGDTQTVTIQLQRKEGGSDE